jgi:uncharacterized protein (TIGR02001 family)
MEHPLMRAMLLAAALAGWSASAAAEIGVSVSASSQERFRSYSLSRGYPVAAIDLSYDHPNGFYAALSASTVFAPGRPELLGFKENLGFARKLDAGFILDAGIIDARYTHYSSKDRSSGYTELYVGAITKPLSARLYYSPNYFRSNMSTLYGELDASFRAAPKWWLDAHIGALRQIGGPSLALGRRTFCDWRLGSSVDFGSLRLRLAWSGGGPGKDFYDKEVHSRRALVLSVSKSF